MSEPTHIEQVLLDLCDERFDDCAKLDLDADFFDALGIDSMQAMELLEEIEEHFDIEVPDYEMQDVRTLRELARIVAARAA